MSTPDTPRYVNPEVEAERVQIRAVLSAVASGGYELDEALLEIAEIVQYPVNHDAGGPGW